MNLIKQTLYCVTIKKPKTQWDDNFFVEADNFDEALSIAKEVIQYHYNGWNIKTIDSHSPIFKSTTKTITVEL